LEIPSSLSAYTSPAEIGSSSTISQWNYSLESGDDKTEYTTSGLSGESAARTTAEIKTEYVQEPYLFSGSYGKNLLQEVARYGQVAAQIAADHSFDIIHAHDWMTFPAGIAAKALSGKPLVVHVHATEIDRSGEHVNPAVFAIEKEGMMNADKVITVSNWTKKIAIRDYGIDESKIEVVHNGINPKETAGAGRDFSPQLNSPVVTFLGRITHQKGPMYFVEAARKVHRQFPDVHFVVAGSGDQLPQMIERIAQEKLSDRFHFTGFLKGDDVDRVWAMSTVYVMPSVSEPFGIAPLEAIQAGVPVILSKQAGVS
jgi:glycosyltransferase involved in cell wall biosynthesis